MKKIFSLFALFMIAITIAQVPQKMSYQAVIRDASSALVTNSTIAMRISILQGTASGSSVYTETQTTTTNANGLATLQIGGGTVVSGTFSAINWGASSYYIKTETDPLGGTNYTIVGTSQLLSVPYALYAGSTAPTGSTSWSTTGNTGTSSATNFIGTTDNNDIVFKRNNIQIGKLNDSNLSLGTNALNSPSLTGINNIGIGQTALFSNTTGAKNLAIGDNSLYTNTTGGLNVAIGNASLTNNTTGNANCATGIATLTNNTTGSFNSAFGINSLHNNQTGNSNTAVGSNALYYNTNGKPVGCNYFK